MKTASGISAKQLAILETGFSRDWHQRKFMETRQKQPAKSKPPQRQGLGVGPAPAPLASKRQRVGTGKKMPKT